MKTILLLLPFLLFGLFACKHEGIDAEHQKKAIEIIQRVVSGQPLPAGIKGDNTENRKVWGPHILDLFYWTKRTVNNVQVDSVFMTVHVNDTLDDLEFQEDYFKNNVRVSGYHYNIQKGELSYAYSFQQFNDSL